MITHNESGKVEVRSGRMESPPQKCPAGKGDPEFGRAPVCLYADQLCVLRKMS